MKSLEAEVHQLRGMARVLAKHLVKYVDPRRRSAFKRLYEEMMESAAPKGSPSRAKQTERLLTSIFGTSEVTSQGATVRSAARRKAPRSRETEASRASATTRGEGAKAAWVREGVVIPARDLGAAWSMTPQGLGRAAERGELFSLKVNNRLYYSANFLALDRETVAAVTGALGDLSPSEKLIFWMRPHGSLGGKTVAAALEQNFDLARVTRLAESWAAEAGAARAAA